MQSNAEQDGTFIAGEHSDPATISSHTSDPLWLATRGRQIGRRLQAALFSPGTLPAPFSSAISGYLCALLGQALAITLIALLLHIFPVFHFASALVLLVVVLIALGWGVGPSLFALFIGAILLLLLVLPSYFSFTVIHTEDAIGVLLYLVVGLTMSLLTSQVQRERQAAQMLSRRLETIIETLPHPLIFYDTAGRPIRHNRSARETIPLEQQDFPLAQIEQMLRIHNLNDEPFASEDLPLSRALRGEYVIGSELRYIFPGDTTEHVVAISAAPLHSPDGSTLEGAVTIIHDLTALRQAEHQARALASELEALFEAMTDGVFVYDAAGQIRRMNIAARTLLARYIPQDDFSIPATARAERYPPRSSDEKDFSPEQVPVIRMLHGEVFTGNRAADVLVRTFTGEDLWLNMSGTPLYDEAKQITGAIAIARDVTERRLLERRTRTTLEALLQMAQVMMRSFDSDPSSEELEIGGSRELMQRLAVLTQQVLGCHRLGITGIEPETERLYPLAVVGLSEEQEHQWWQEQEQQTVSLAESADPVLLARFRAREIFVMDLTQPPYNEQPNPYGIRQMLVAPIGSGTRLLGFFTLDYSGLDHTYPPDEIELVEAVTRFAALIMERERLLEAAAMARASELAARETANQMDGFVSIASHELKTPLTSIKGNLQITTRRLKKLLPQLEANAPTEQRTIADMLVLLERAERQANVLNRLVNDLVDMSRLQTEQLELQLTRIDLAALVQEVVEVQRLATVGHPLHAEIPQREGVFIRADAIRIEQVLGNYLSNALKYSPTDLPVEVRLTVEEKYARVEVADQGPGLSQEQQARIWERFYRVPGIIVQSGSSIGLGLGLYINRMLIEQHGGQVGIKSSPGQGATFWFTLPLTQTSLSRKDLSPE